MKKRLSIQSTCYPDNPPKDFNDWAKNFWQQTHRPYREAKVIRLKKTA